MIGKHEAWDARIVSRLDDLRIDLAGDVQFDLGKVTSSLWRYGFAVLAGLGSSNERNATASELIELAAHLGAVVPQSPRGEAVEDVRDFSDVEARDNRGYRSRGELSPHSDPPTLILLHCLRRAKSGGETCIVNVRSIQDRIADAAPELLAELYRELPYWLVEGQHGDLEAGPSPEKRPVLTVRDGLVSCVYYRPFIEMAAKALGEPLTELQQAAMNRFDEWASSPELTLRFQLQPGQTLLLHNRTVLHARADYEDWPDPDRRRHLLRVWIDAPSLLPVAPVHELGNLFGPAR